MQQQQGVRFPHPQPSHFSIIAESYLSVCLTPVSGIQTISISIHRTVLSFVEHFLPLFDELRTYDTQREQHRESVCARMI